MGEYCWENNIEFTGALTGPEAITGTADVTYPSVDRGTEYSLDRYGLDIRDCVQTFELDLTYVD